MWYDPLMPNLVYFTFIGLKLISVVWVSLRLRPSFTLSYWQKGEPMSCTIVFLPHSAACRGLCYVLTEAQALKSLCKDPIPQGFPVWLLLIMSLVINARNPFLLVCKNGYSQEIFKVASSSNSKNFHWFAHCGLLYRFWVMCNPLPLTELVNRR